MDAKLTTELSRRPASQEDGGDGRWDDDRDLRLPCGASGSTLGRSIIRPESQMARTSTPQDSGRIPGFCKMALASALSCGHSGVSNAPAAFHSAKSLVRGGVIGWHSPLPERVKSALWAASSRSVRAPELRLLGGPKLGLLGVWRTPLGEHSKLGSCGEAESELIGGDPSEDPEAI